MKLKKIGVGVLSIAVLAVGGTTAFASSEWSSNITSSIKVMEKGESDETIKGKEMMEKEIISEVTSSIEAKEHKEGERLETPEGKQMMEVEIID